MELLDNPVFSHADSMSKNIRNLHGRGVPEQKAMQRFLGCIDPPAGASWDFNKGRIRFEYKFSSPTPTQPARNRRCGWAAASEWVWNNLWGQSGQKVYDYLILEGAAENSSEVFLIPHDDLFRFTENGRLSWLRSNTRPKGGKRTMFVWQHNKTKEQLKEFVDRIPESIEDLEQPNPALSAQGRLFT